MWELFSYYGMRAILVIFLTGALIGDNPGWEWTSEAALSLLTSQRQPAILTGVRRPDSWGQGHERF